MVTPEPTPEPTPTPEPEPTFPSGNISVKAKSNPWSKIMSTAFGKSDNELSNTALYGPGGTNSKYFSPTNAPEIARREAERKAKSDQFYDQIKSGMGMNEIAEANRQKRRAEREAKSQSWYDKIKNRNFAPGEMFLNTRYQPENYKLKNYDEIMAAKYGRSALTKKKFKKK
jgi:hypothetical protein